MVYTLTALISLFVGRWLCGYYLKPMLFKLNRPAALETPGVPLTPVKPVKMFKFQISIAITDESNNTVANIPLPAIESGETLGNVLSIAENLVKPFLPVVEGVLGVKTS